MNWSELQQQWQTQASALPAWDAAEFERRRRAMALKLKTRDWLEAGVGAFVTVVLASGLPMFGWAAWPAWLGVALIAGLTGFFVRERRRAHAATPPAEAPWLDRVDAEIAELRHQHRLLRQAFWWYVLPCMLAITLFILGIVAALPGTVPLRFWKFLAWYGLACAGLSVAITWANRKAADRLIAPKLRELTALRETLKQAQDHAIL